jgi:enoyl-CoA hydratase/carnithine racemase
MYSDIFYEVKNHVGKITLNRPEQLNAWTTHTKEEFKSALRLLEKDKQVKVIVITGVGHRAFCSGQDLHESKELKPDNVIDWIQEFDNVYWMIRHLGKPSIAAVNGAAVGSGWQLALLCDFRIASENARFAMTEIDVGLPCLIGATLIYLTLGEALTKELILTGKFLNAQEALKVNLVNKVVPQEQLEETVNQFAQDLASKPPIAMMLNKKWFTRLSDQRYLAAISFAKEAHQIGYATGEPKKAHEEFFAARKVNKNKSSQK